VIYVALALVVVVIVLVLAGFRERARSAESLHAREREWAEERLRLVSAVKSPTYLPTFPTTTATPRVPTDEADYQSVGTVSLDEPAGGN
jgi:hypothetical protein